MIDPIATPLAAALPTGNAAPAAALPGMSAADAPAAARFNALMAATPAAPPPETLPAPPDAAPQAATLGDKILQGLGGLSGDLRQSWQEASALLDHGQNMSTADMLRLQMSLTQVAIQYDLVGKAIGKSTQNIEQLVKIQ